MSLAALLPELAADIQGALVQIGRGDLADQVRAAPVLAMSRDDFARAVILEVQPEPEAASGPGDIVSLHDEIGVGLELDAAGRLARIEVSGYEDLLARFGDLRVRRALFEGEGFRAVEMFVFDVPRLQAFLEANPEYSMTLSGAPPRPEEAREEFEALPPAGWPCQRKWMILFADPAGGVIGVADVLAGLFVPAVWHVGLFITANALHGSGRPRAMYEALEAWMKSRGARWLRLGVVERNVRGEKFWRARGFTELRTRADYEAGGQRHLLRVMAKPLAAADWDWYRRNVPRDDPSSP
jgi:GNAT superfamily N-acetyltransferase